MARDGVAARARLRPPGRAALSRRRGRLRRQAQHPADARRRMAAASPWCRRPPRAEDILRHEPDGIFLSNGPGDPAATGEYAVPVLRDADRHGQADLRHLPRPSDAGAGARRPDPQDGQGASRRQPSGQGRGDRQGRDHQPEPRLCRRSREPAGRDRARPTSRCSTRPTRGCGSPASRSFRCSTTPKPAPARRTAIICSSGSSR